MRDDEGEWKLVRLPVERRQGLAVAPVADARNGRPGRRADDDVAWHVLPGFPLGTDAE